jgi:putative protease
MPAPAPAAPAPAAPAAPAPAAPAPTAPAPTAPAPAQPEGERVGVVTHYYGHLSVAAVKLETGRLRVGDRIRIHGHTSDFTQRVESLQVEHRAVTEVGPSDDFALKVDEHAREHDVVYKLAP